MNELSLSECIGSNGIFTDGDWVESKDQDPDGEVRLIQLADIGVGSFLDKSARFLTMETAKRLRCTFLEPGDLLIARMPDPIGRACIFPGLSQSCATVVDVCVLRPDPRLLNVSYAKWMINSPRFLQKVAGFVSGSTRQRISRGNLAPLSIPLPPLDEQKRIAAILDQADELRRKRQRAIERLNQLGQAIFHEMFGDPKGNPRGLPVVRLGDVSDFYSGNSLPEGEAFSSQTDGYLLLKVSDLNHPQNQHDVICAANWSPLPGTRAGTCPPNALVFPKRGGAIGTNKKRWLRRSAILDPNLMGVHPHEDRLTMSFLNGWFQTFNLSEIASGSSVPQLNKKDLAPLELVLPPMEEQGEYAQKIDELSRQQGKLARAFEYDNQLFTSLQHRAFQGEL